MELSLFKDDPMHRFLGKVGLEKKGVTRKWYFAFIIIAAGWIIPLILSALEGRAISDTIIQSFLYDINHPVQVLIIVFLLFSEDKLDHYIKNAGIVLRNSGLVDDIDKVEKAIGRVERMRTSIEAEIVCIVMGIIFMLTWAIPLWSRQINTWQVHFYGGIFSYTIAGWWVLLTFGPFVQYYWVRWFWKVVIWTTFLYNISKAKLKLAVGHPDRVGGLRFLGDAQAGFGVLIFAIGLMVVTFVFKKLLIDKVPIFDITNTLIVFGFVTLAPCAFLAPLMIFTKKLHDAKLEGIQHYDIILTRFINAFEAKHLHPASTPSDPLAITQELNALSGIINLSGHVSKMRVVPFDLNTLSRLFASAATPMLPLIPKVVPWPKLASTLELFFK